MTWHMLGQVRPGGATVFALVEGKPGALVRQIFVMNDSVDPITFKMWFDNDGASETMGSRIIEETSVAATSHIELDVYIGLDNPNAILRCKPNAVGLTFTAFGEIP